MPYHGLDMNWKDAIHTDPKVMTGKPVIAGTRLTVDHIVGLLADGWSEAEIVDQYEITPEQIRACLAYARDILTDVGVYPPARAGGRG